MESTQEWAARIKAENEARTPEQVAADKAESEAWLASLPVLPPLPTLPGEVQVVFIKSERKTD